MKLSITYLFNLLKAKLPKLASKILTFMSALFFVGLGMISLPEGSIPKLLTEHDVAQWMMIVGVVGSVISMFTAKDDKIKPTFQKKLEEMVEKMKNKKLGIEEPNKEA